MSDEIMLGWPVSRQWQITQAFGNTDVPEGAPYKVHYGVDLATPVGTEVQAVDYGTVKFAGEDPNAAQYKGGYGLMMVISHIGVDKVESYYCHLSECFLRAQQAVQPGMAIAKTGNTGFTTGPHLHFGVKVNGEWVDPELYCDPSTLRQAQGSGDAPGSGPVEVQPVEQLFRVVNGCRIRLLPDVSNDLTICGWLADGLTVRVLGIADIGNGNYWAQLDEEGNRWCAIVHEGWRYLEGK